jgi:hypothetical protein
MLEKVVIPEALELFLSFNELVNLCQVNKIINKLFTISREKRTLWNSSHLPKDHRFVYRLKLEWEYYEKLDSFQNIKELELIFTPVFHFPNGFPNTLVSLNLGDKFDRNLRSLPQNLKQLEFGKYCEITLVSGMLPKNLKELKFGDFCKIEVSSTDDHQRLDTREFPQECIFPKSLTRIEFGAGFSGSLEPLCASNIKEIRLNRYYEKNIPENLRDKVRFVCYEDYHVGWALDIE